MKIHNLKIQKEFFEDVKSGEKSFELRKDDRNYRLGDVINLTEVDATSAEETGRTALVEIIYKLDKFDGLYPGYCILGVRTIDSGAKLNDIIKKHIKQRPAQE